MAIIRVTKQFNFEAAHALLNYNGNCKNMHGHSYKLYVTVSGEPITCKNNPKLGMVIDFGELKKIVKENIIDKFDHAVIINNDILLSNTKQIFDRLITTDYQPTCENMVFYFSKIIKEKLPTKINLVSVKLYETTTSYAEWFAEDNI